MNGVVASPSAHGSFALKNKDVRKDGSHLTCCRTNAKLSPTSCDSHLPCKPRFHIEDSKSELKVTCALVSSSKKIQFKSSQSKLKSTNKSADEEAYLMTKFIVYDRHNDRKMDATSQSISTNKGVSLMNNIMEVQWYVCLKDQINQQIILHDVRENLFDSSEEETAAMKSSPSFDNLPLIASSPSTCNETDDAENSQLSDAVTECEAYFIPPLSLEDSFALPNISTESSADATSTGAYSEMTESPRSVSDADVFPSPISKSPNCSVDDDLLLQLQHTPPQPDLDSSFLTSTESTTTTVDPQSCPVTGVLVCTNDEGEGKSQDLSVASQKEIRLTLIEEHVEVVHAHQFVPLQYSERETSCSGTSTFECFEMEPMEVEVQESKGWYPRAAVHKLLVCLVLIFGALAGIKYIPTQWEQFQLTAPLLLTSPGRLPAQFSPREATIYTALPGSANSTRETSFAPVLLNLDRDGSVSSEDSFSDGILTNNIDALESIATTTATTTIATTAVTTAFHTTTASALTASKSSFMTTMKKALLLPFEWVSRIWCLIKGRCSPIKLSR